MSKGSKQRPIEDRKQFEQEYERIFPKKKEKKDENKKHGVCYKPAIPTRVWF